MPSFRHGVAGASFAGPASACLQVTVDRKSILEGTGSRPALDHLLERCDGRVSITDLVRTSPEPEEPTWRLLYGLLLLGLVASTVKAASGAKARVEVIREEVLARIEHAGMRDHYKLLRVNTGSSREQILQAYYAVARAYHPDRFRSGPLEDLRERVERYFAQVTEAYDTLYNPETRAAYDQELAEAEQTEATQDTAGLARENFKRAKSLIAKGRLPEAVPWLQNAIQQDALNASYRVELGKVMASNPRMRKEAEQHLIEANRLDPSFVGGYFELGKLYLKQANPEKAARMFREVLRWEPGHLEATARLKKLG